MCCTGLPGLSVGKESDDNGGDPGLIHESGRSPTEGNSNPSTILAWEIPWTERSLAGYSSWSHRELAMTWQLTATTMNSTEPLWGLSDAYNVQTLHNAWFNNTSDSLRSRKYVTARLGLHGPHLRWPIYRPGKLVPAWGRDSFLAVSCILSSLP